MPHDRVCCCVPFCRRTTAADRLRPDTEWLCQKHWSVIPKSRRRAYSRARRKRAPFVNYAAARLWRRLKAQAIEAAVGIGGGGHAG